MTHLIAAGATLAWIRGGSEAEPDPSARARYIATHATKWQLGWFIWMIAAISLIAFFSWWAARSPKPRLARIALVVSFAAIAVDFFADTLFIGWIPDDYARYGQLATIVSEVLANGLYSIAGALLMIASSPMRPWFAVWGWVVWVSGFALAAAGATRWDAAIVASSGLLLATLIPWVWLAGNFIEESL